MVKIGEINITMGGDEGGHAITAGSSVGMLTVGLSLSGAILWTRCGYTDAMEDCDRLMEVLGEMKRALREKAQEFAPGAKEGEVEF